MNEGATQCCYPMKLHNFQTFLKLSLLPEANGVQAYRLTPMINSVDGCHQTYPRRALEKHFDEQIMIFQTIRCSLNEMSFRFGVVSTAYCLTFCVLTISFMRNAESLDIKELTKKQTQIAKIDALWKICIR